MTQGADSVTRFGKISLLWKTSLGNFDNFGLLGKFKCCLWSKIEKESHWTFEKFFGQNVTELNDWSNLLLAINGQSYKVSTSVNYNFIVVITSKLLIFTTLDS